MKKEDILHSFTKEQLKEALKKKEQDEFGILKPQKVPIPDFSSLHLMCENYIDFLTHGKTNDANSLSHFIFESAMETFYGEDVWEWINKHFK